MSDDPAIIIRQCAQMLSDECFPAAAKLLREAGKAHAKLEKATIGLITAISEDGDHGFGASDHGCSICRAIEKARAVLPAQKAPS